MVTKERMDRAMEMAHLMRGDSNPELYSKRLLESVQKFHGFSNKIEVTSELIQLYHRQIKEPRKDPSSEKDGNIAVMMALDRRIRYFTPQSMTTNISRTTTTFPDEQFFDYKLTDAEAELIIQNVQAYKNCTLEKLILAHFTGQFKSEEEFGVIRAKEQFPGAQDIELLLKVQDQQIPKKQLKKLYDILEQDWNKSLIEHYNLKKEFYDLGAGEYER